MELELSMFSQNSPPLYLSLSQFNTVYTLTTYHTKLGMNCLPCIAKDGGKQWQTTPKTLPRMQCARAIPVTWLGSGSCQPGL